VTHDVGRAREKSLKCAMAPAWIIGSATDQPPPQINRQRGQENANLAYITGRFHRAQRTV
jgi:hypothetical protein